MDGYAAKLSAKAAKGKKGGMRPKTHHLFYVLVVICGWLAPPLAVAVRFGIGRDFFINVICTICGYFPGHFHNFYCQSIRNNKTAARTPKWAVKYGLVKVKDKRAGRHQWAGRYDERLPDSARNEYADQDSTSSIQEGQEWDGRGPEPEHRSSRLGNGLGGGKKKHGGFHITSPWDTVVDEDEVQGAPRRRDDDVPGGTSAKPYDPLDNEEFFPSGNDHQSMPPSSASGGGRKLKSKGFLGKNRSRYEDTSTNAGSGDRFDRMKAARGRSEPSAFEQDDFQDDFEREINGGARRSAAPTSSSAAAQRFDTFDDERPEDAWASSASSRPRDNGGGASTRMDNPRREEAPKRNTGDGDLFNHTF